MSTEDFVSRPAQTFIREHFPSHTHGSDRAAQRARNSRARELRKAGYTVKCSAWDFSDLARTRDYVPEARWPEGKP